MAEQEEEHAQVIEDIRRRDFGEREPINLAQDSTLAALVEPMRAPPRSDDELKTLGVRRLFEIAITEEKVAERIYTALSSRTTNITAKIAMKRLAREEAKHAQQLAAWLKQYYR
jgi:rubrerythrin